MVGWHSDDVSDHTSEFYEKMLHWIAVCCIMTLHSNQNLHRVSKQLSKNDFSVRKWKLSLCSTRKVAVKVMGWTEGCPKTKALRQPRKTQTVCGCDMLWLERVLYATNSEREYPAESGCEGVKGFSVMCNSMKADIIVNSEAQLPNLLSF